MLVQSKFKFGIIKNLENLCLYIFFLLTIYIFLFSIEHTLFLVRVGFILVGALLGFFWCVRNINVALKPCLLTFSTILFWLVCALCQDTINYEPKYMVYTISYIWMSMLLLKNKYSHWGTIVTFVFGSGALLQKILFGNFYSNQLLMATSRNYVSVLMLLLVLFYYVSCHDKNKTISIIPAVVFFIISIFAIGRGGIIVSGFLLIALILYKFQPSKYNKCRFLYKYKSILWIIVFLLVVLVLIGVSNGLLQDYFERIFPRFYEQGSMDQSRIIIWSKFLSNNMDSFRNFLLGSDTRLARYDGNLHNSFLQSYGSFGLIGFLTFLFLIVRSYIQGYKQKDYVWLILFTTLLMRAMTDRVFFQGYCELFFYYFVFYWDFNKNWLNGNVLEPVET